MSDIDPKLLLGKSWLDSFPNQRLQLGNILVSATWNPRNVFLVGNSGKECEEGSRVMGTGHRL